MFTVPGYTPKKHPESKDEVMIEIGVLKNAGEPIYDALLSDAYTSLLLSDEDVITVVDGVAPEDEHDIRIVLSQPNFKAKGLRQIVVNPRTFPLLQQMGYSQQTVIGCFLDGGMPSLDNFIERGKQFDETAHKYQRERIVTLWNNGAALQTVLTALKEHSVEILQTTAEPVPEEIVLTTIDGVITALTEGEKITSLERLVMLWVEKVFFPASSIATALQLIVERRSHPSYDRALAYAELGICLYERALQTAQS